MHKVNPSYMKPGITLLFFICFLSVLSSQDQFSLLQEDAVWVQEHYIGDGYEMDTTWYEEYRILGDTIIDNTTYQKLYKNGLLWGALLETEKRVLHHFQGKIDTILDFNLVVGDTVLIDPGSGEQNIPRQWMILQRIDTLPFSDGTMRKHFRFLSNELGTVYLEGPFPITWIDGMGSTRGLLIDKTCSTFDATRDPNRSIGPFCYGLLLCYQNDSQVRYSASFDPIYSCTAEGVVSDTEEFLPSGALQLFPNPASETVTLSLPFDLDLTGWQYYLVDAFGRVVSQPKQVRNHQESIAVSHFPAGIYRMVVQSGRQVVTRGLVVALD